MKVESLGIYNDSQLIVYQIIDEYQARGERMVAYLQKAKDLLKSFSSYAIHQVLSSQNTQADALARFVSMKDAKLLEVIPVNFLSRPSIHLADQHSQAINCSPMATKWMTLII